MSDKRVQGHVDALRSDPFAPPPDPMLRAFLRTLDPVWDRLPERWEDAPFIGSGLVGAMPVVDRQRNRILWLIGRSDVGKLDFPGVARTPIRTQIGALAQCFAPGVVIQGGHLRIDLWNAELRGTIRTNEGPLRFTACAPTGSAGFLIDFNCANTRLDWCWEPEIEPGGRTTQEDNLRVFTKSNTRSHPRSDVRSGGFSVAWEERTAPDGSRRFVCTIGSAPVNRRCWNTGDSGVSARTEALKEADRMRHTTSRRLKRHHRAWWHQQYRASFLSFSHRELTALYWIQIYKLASSTRPDRPMLDNHGVWSMEPTYGFATWDFNVQATYRIHLTANLGAFGDPLLRFMDRNFNAETMWDARHGEYRAGMRQQTFLRYRMFDRDHWEHRAHLPCDGPAKFLWGVHNVVMHYRHRLDATMIPRFSLMLEAGVRAMLAGMREEADGRLHIPSGCSWECWTGRDPTGLLAILNWALDTLVEFSSAAGTEPLHADRWRALRSRIAPYPQDARGVLLGDGQPPVPHRHWTHLMMLYPLDIADGSDTEEVARLHASVRCWASMSAGLNGAPPQAGFSCPAGIALYAYLRAHAPHVDTAVIAQLADLFLYGLAERGPCVWPSTLYREYGPVLETPIFMASAIQECFLQSRRDGVHVFPAVPEAWPDVLFVNWHAEGDVEVSACRRGGHTKWVAVRSRSGRPFELHLDLSLDGIFWNGRRRPPPRCAIQSERHVRLHMERDVPLVLSRRPRPDLTVRTITNEFGDFNAFGLNARFLKKRPYRKTPAERPSG